MPELYKKIGTKTEDQAVPRLYTKIRAKRENRAVLEQKEEVRLDHFSFLSAFLLIRVFGFSTCTKLAYRSLVCLSHPPKYGGERLFMNID